MLNDHVLQTETLKPKKEHGFNDKEMGLNLGATNSVCLDKLLDLLRPLFFHLEINTSKY